MNAEQSNPFPPMAVLNFHALRMTRQYGPDNEMVQLRDRVNSLVESAKRVLESADEAAPDSPISRAVYHSGLRGALAPFGGAA